MSFSMTVSGGTISELKSALNAAAKGLVGDGATEPDRTTAEKPAPKAEPKAAPKKTAPVDDEPGLVYEDDVRPPVIKLSKDHGRDAVLEIVGNFEREDGESATKAQEVQEADWPELVKRIKATQKRLDREKADADA